MFTFLLTVRFVLLCLNYTGLRRMRVAVSRRFGDVTGSSFASLTVLQFHLPFWVGRTLPNMFALIPGKPSARARQMALVINNPTSQ
jgi:alpha-1,6-mannosyltransferase